jgi:HEAT repeat protein
MAVPTKLITLILIVLALPTSGMGQQARSVSELVEQFQNTRVFWRQFDVAKQLVALHDTSVFQKLAPDLKDDDRHLRGNAAFVFASLGDYRGFEVIKAILDDRSERPEGQGIPGGRWSVGAQISADRYYAVHLFGDLKDRRAVPILIPLLPDPQVSYIVPWALGEIGDKSAVDPLIQRLSDKNPDMRVLAVYALEKLRAKEALPHLRVLLDDNEEIHFDGLGTVSEAAKGAIANLEVMR